MTYPVTNSQQDIVDGLNYALSGPGGLGQNFAGFNTYTTGYLTGNFRIPFSEPTATSLYVAPIALSNAQQLDSRTIKYTFASAQPTPPFAVGNGLTVTGITPTNWNSNDLKNAGYSINQIGVIACTTTDVTVRTVAEITTALPAYVSGGSISYTSMDILNSTDCDVRVTKLGGQERVFIGAQLDQTLSYTVTSATADMTVYIDITRYTAFRNYDPTNPDFIFDDPVTVVEKVYNYAGLTIGSGTIDIETVFASVIDNPDPGYYRYILEVYFETVSGTLEVTEDEMNLRSISAQVIKP
jgi:hypothetical protein